MYRCSMRRAKLDLMLESFPASPNSPAANAAPVICTSPLQLSLSQLQKETICLRSDDGVVVKFDDNLQKAFPTAEQCNSAKIMQTPGGGDCLWHALLRASKNFPIGLSPSTTISELRRLTLLFFKANKHQSILPNAAFDLEPLYFASPAVSFRISNDLSYD